MEDILDLYEEPYDARRPVVCFDESPQQLVKDVREGEPVRPGEARRQDNEYERCGVCDLMMISEPKRGYREVLVTDRRTQIDFAHTMKHVVQMYPEADVIRVVLDNLNTHKKASLYAAFPPEEARKIARKLEFHYTPKHGSWLNIAEVEFAILTNMCLKHQRIATREEVEKVVSANVQKRNQQTTHVKWQFTTQMARGKLARLYPSNSM